MKNSRGRPRKARRRYPSGQLIQSSAQDRGTPQLRAKRRQLVGNADDARAGSLLGVLAARGLIELAEYKAGVRYAELYFCAANLPTGFALARPVLAALSRSEIVLKRSFPRTIVGSPRARIAFNEARRSVARRSGCHAAAILDDVAIFDRAPGPAPDIESLRSGLDALKRHFEVLDGWPRAIRTA
jgi:hypothetical protein